MFALLFVIIAYVLLTQQPQQQNVQPTQQVYFPGQQFPGQQFPAQTPPFSGASVPQPTTGVNKSTLALTSGISIGTGAATGAIGASTVGTSVGVGAALGAATAGIAAGVAIFAALWSAHLRRAAQARDENSAVNIGVAGFDSDLHTINAAYNARQLDAATAINALQQAYDHYWLLVGPHIQPGRNGCAAGAACANMQQIARTGRQACSGDIGAACCIGCEPLFYSLYDDGTDRVVTSPQGPGAIWVLEHGGNMTSQVKIIGGSSYGAHTRMPYTLQWRAA